MAGTAEEPLLPSWSQGCLVIFLEEELAPDQGVRLQLCRELAGTPAIEKRGQGSAGALGDTAGVQVVGIPLLGVWSHLSPIFPVLSISFYLLPKTKLIR